MAIPHHQSRLFTREEKAKLKAAKILEQERLEAGELRAALGELYEAYDKLYNQTAKLIRLSDKTQEELRRISEQNQQYLRQLETLYLTDDLTKIANRRHFDMHLSSEWKRARRSGDFICLVMADIDHFKDYNDSFGHIRGDECLIQVAQALTGAARRPSDLLARYGGEEFACILPETDLAGATEVAETMRRNVLELALPAYKDSDKPVTISLGVAAARVAADIHEKELLRVADLQLYQAKYQGRNRVSTDENVLGEA